MCNLPTSDNTFSLEKSKLSEEGEKLVCILSYGDTFTFPNEKTRFLEKGKKSLSSSDIVPFSIRNQIFQKRGKSSFEFGKTMILLFFHQKTVFFT